MTDELRTLLREAAASPATIDYEALVARGRRWRRGMLTGAALGLVAVVSVAVAAVVWQQPPAPPVIGDRPSPPETARPPQTSTPDGSVLAVVEAPSGDAGRAVVADQAELDAYFQQWIEPWRFVSPSHLPTLGPQRGAVIVAVDASQCRNQRFAFSEVTIADVATVHFTPVPGGASACPTDGSGGSRLVYIIAVARADAARISDVAAMLGPNPIDAGWTRPDTWPPFQWYGPDDQDTPTQDVTVTPGPVHCDWEHIAFLRPPPDHQAPGVNYYVADRAGLLVGGYQAETALPADAVWSGYQTVGWKLWFAPSDDAAYLVADDGHVERWPASRGGCA
jgi:hypothetical protein